MIICRTPFRISLFGGGTDYPEWFNENNGQVISMAINKYCYSTLRQIPNIFPFKYRLRYFKNEFTKTIDQIKHKSIKATLKEFDKTQKNIEIVHSADLPALSGLGSSSAFTVTLINLIMANNNQIISKRDLARKAIYIEREILKESVGCQDQFASAFGGFNIMTFKHLETKIDPILISEEKIKNLLDNMILCFTGYQRVASKIERDKIKNIYKNYNSYQEIYNLSVEAKKILYSTSSNYLTEISRLLNQAWLTKKQLSKMVSNHKIDEMISFSLKNGAAGAKILGAGGGGFLLFLTKNKRNKLNLLKKLKKFNIVDFSLDTLGSQILYRS